jgi:two-component system, CitB family, sensor kinase
VVVLRGSMRRRPGELTLAGQFLVLQLVVVALLLGIVAVLSVRQSTATFTEQRGAQMRSVAEYVAGLPPLRSHLARARTDDVTADATPRALAPYADRGVQLSGADGVLVVGLDGEVLASSEPSRVGTQADLGDSDATEGRQWSGDVEDEGERVVVAHAPIYSGDGELLGIVVAEQAYPSVWTRLTGGSTDLTLFLGVGALLGIAGSLVVSRVVKRGTRGLAATEIANLADQREALLHAIREGVVAVGTDGRITMANDAARVTLGLGDVDPVGRRVGDLGLDPHVVDLLSGDAGGEDAAALVGSRVVVFNRREASAGGRGIGSVTTLRDRTELVSLQSQLSSNLSITDTLRAQTHEFDNRLHTISGLVQLGEYDEVARLVGTLTRRRAEVSEAVSKRLAEPALAALMIAKHAVA